MPRRRLLVTCVAAGAVIAGVVAGVVWVNRPSPDGGQTSAISGAPFDSSTPTDKGKQLPVSAALTPTQLIVPVRIGANWDLWLADSQQQAPVLRLTSDPLPDTTPVISPDRRTVIYTHDLNLDGKRTLLVKGASVAGDGQPLFDPMPTECQGTIARPAWNPVRSDELAIPCVDEAGKAGLYRITTSGQVLGSVQLPTGTGRVDDPAYSPDGQRLVFWAAPMSTWDGGTLYTVPVSGGTPKVLLKTTTRGEDADGVWSADGKYIAFRRRMPDGTTGGNFDIFRVTTDGSARLERLTDNPADEQDPTYSPSGGQIAYKSAEQDPKRPVNDISRTWVMDSSGHHQHVLWSEGPDGSQTAAGWGPR